jgi:DNA-binding MarR family transcriptional regulator
VTPFPLSRLVGQALAAYTIELDNEAEHRLPHQTTRGRREPDAPRRTGPWLVSFSLSANVLQYLEAGPLPVAELRRRARTSKLLLTGLRRWGYVAIVAPGGEPLRTPPQDAATVRLRNAGTTAQAVWRSLPPVIEERWRTRLGPQAVDRLERATRSVFEQLPFDPPAYLPVVHPTQGGRAEVPVSSDEAGDVPKSAAGSLPLSALFSGVLLAYTLDVESRTKISLPVGATTLGVIDSVGVRVRDLPGLTGVSKEANAMVAGWLERRGCAQAVRDPAASRGQVLRLTPKGDAARRRFLAALDATEGAWRTRFGDEAVHDLRAALEAVVGDGAIPSSPVAAGLEPYPDNWRARVRPPRTLPHYPMVLHRGGYPDGS